MLQRDAWHAQYVCSSIPTCQRESPSHAAPVVLEYVAAHQVGRMLDIGCGNGRNARYFASHGVSVIGIDVSTDALQACAAAARARPAGHGAVHYVMNSMGAPLPFRSACVDGVICFTALENLTEPCEVSTFRRELARVVRPGGMFAVYFLETNDEYYAPLLKSTDRGRISRDPSTGLVQRIYGLEEIVDEICPSFLLRKQHAFRFSDVRAGKAYARALRVAVFQR